MSFFKYCPWKKWKWFICWQKIAYKALVVGCILFFRKKSLSGAKAYNPGCIVLWNGMPHVEWSNQSIVPKLNSPSHEWALHIHEHQDFSFFFIQTFFCMYHIKASTTSHKTKSTASNNSRKNVFLFIWKARQPAYVVVRAEVQDLKQCQG